MASSLLNCSQRLVACEQRLFYLSQKSIDNLFTTPSIGDLINVCKNECDQIGNEIKSLEQTVDNLVKTVKDPFKSVMMKKIGDLKEGYDSFRSKVYSESTIQIQKNAIVLDELFEQFQKELMQSVIDLNRIDKLADRGLEVISPALTSPQFNKACTLLHSIESTQSESINKLLIKIDMLISKMRNSKSDRKKNECLEFIRNLLFNKLPSCKMGQSIQQNIFDQILSEAGTPQRDDEWGKNHALDDLSRLSTIIRSYISLQNKPFPLTGASRKEHTQLVNPPFKNLSDEMIYEILNPPPDIYHINRSSKC
ncbi:MAG TPA: hypothetical protein VLG49_01635 [Rhabdochlamydiaceae bacterium]|nr:hypothetical protein [Rhabdochlamydiaceae bacterium]HSX13228.1 hypothetical protein [Chlamydiales bacterium]